MQRPKLAPTLLFLLAALAGTTSHSATPSISAGTTHSVALKSDGTVRTWGDDSSGELGAGRLVASALPVNVPSASGATTIAVGFAHVLARKGDGSVWSWGANDNGQLGDGTTIRRSVATRLNGIANVTALAAGDSHSVALKSDGTVWAWGSNQYGQLGDGSTTGRLTPVQVASLTGVVAISATHFHTVALKSDGSVWAWGYGGDGQLGDGASTSRTTPVRVSSLSGVVAVAAGTGFTLAIRSDGTAWGWGRNDGGYVGDGTTTNRSTPVQVSGLTNVVAIVAGYEHAAALKGDGSVWAWGYGGEGQVGDGTYGTRLTPVAVSGMTNVASIAASGGYHTLALKRDGSVWSWGYNLFGQLGNGTYDTSNVPVPVNGLGSVASIFAGLYQSVALKTDGSVMMWGANESGQLGDGGITSRPTPDAVGGLSNVIAVSGGDRHTLALKGDGTVWAWGDNATAQLGDGTLINQSRPVQVSGLTGVIAISAGSFHSMALKSDGSVWAWGENWFNTLGDGTGARAYTPVRISGVADVIAISAGSGTTVLKPGFLSTFHSAALKRDGTVWTWGDNRFGQLGDFTTTDQSTPILVPGLSGVIAISAGGDHTLAVLGDGTVWAWGRNADGQLGIDLPVPFSPFPVQVPDISGVTAIASGARHSVALKSDRTVWAWGANEYGQLGDGTSNARLSPVAVAGFGGATAVSAGTVHTLALREDGTAWGWGGNTVGQVGDGTLAARFKPVVVLRELGAGTIAANDWFLDLNPGAPKAIPSDKVPAFLALASGSAASVVANVSADVRFRAQDVGKRIHVFAYAPASLAKAAKDGPACVLAQLTPSGLQQVTASNLQSYTSNVTSSQQQAVTLLDNVPVAQIGGATFCVGSGTTGTESLGNNQCVVTVPAGQVCVAPDTSSSGPAANAPGALSGLWWNSGESGWGIHFTQRRNIVFAAWYTYDGNGNPKWYVASNCTMPSAGATSGTCSGALYEVNGPTFFGTAFNPAAVNVVTAGSLQVNFQNANAASMTYTVGAQTRTVAITRQPITSGTTAPTVDYTDLWWNPNESGWGMAIAQQYSIMFLAWYVYDGAGKPVWYVASNCTVSGNGCSGTLYRTTGPAFGPTFNSSQIQVFTAGTVSLNFTDANNGTLSYSVNGVSSTKTITRQLF